MSKTYPIKINPLEHIYQDSLFKGEMENLKINSDGHLLLEEGALSGTFYSEEIDHSEFSEAVGSWCAVTSKDATCEFFVSLKVDGAFSDYISYGKFGLGLQNASHNQTNALIKLDEDEIKVLNDKFASGFKYKIKLERKSLDVKSGEVSLITITFKLKDKAFDRNLDKSGLPDKVAYAVPKLYQHDVPVIGGSICSATSSTMLLKYKGHSFKDINPLEHRYIAGIVKDYGNNIYGNWVYNCVGMSSFGETAYVKRFYGATELFQSIKDIGPLSASIKGTVNYVTIDGNRKGSYTSSGHLLVVTGYEITNNGIFVLINDPNVKEVSIKVTLDNFLDFWRNVAYIIE